LSLRSSALRTFDGSTRADIGHTLRLLRSSDCNGIGACLNFAEVKPPYVRLSDMCVKRLPATTPKESRTMTERPLAELHADAIDVHLSFDGAFAALGIVNGSQAYIVSLPRDALEEFIVRAVDKLATAPLPRVAE
jgi:hypothetical protein